MVTSAKEKSKMEEERKSGGQVEEILGPAGRGVVLGPAKEGLLRPGGGECSYCRKNADL